ncbi:DUF397 domain-containing protein [Actinokineospora sp. HUAS TT18]|uniref:DUF397 domain-containing protein n=1 Tax=Actinokineospora sp. HUAS TT18 TaxID=3447451 RepID=UPI003F51FD3E
MTHGGWRKSSFSNGPEGNCVEVALRPFLFRHPIGCWPRRTIGWSSSTCGNGLFSPVLLNLCSMSMWSPG